MKIGRSTTVVVILALAMTVILGFLYALPMGRRARHETMRVLRAARNTTGVYPLPLLTVRMWHNTRPGVLLIEVFESGQLVLSRPGERLEWQLTRDVSARIIETGKMALGDFNSSGCDTEPGELNSALYLLVDGDWLASVCRGASDWPRGFETKQLFAEIESRVPGVFDGFLARRMSAHPHAVGVGFTVRSRVLNV